MALDNGMRNNVDKTDKVNELLGHNCQKIQVTELEILFSFRQALMESTGSQNQ